MRIAGRWIDSVEEELGDLPREEKPWIRELAGRMVVLLPGRRPGARTSCSSGRCVMTAGPVGHEAAFAANRALWEAWTGSTPTGDFYDLAGFKRGRRPGPALRDRGGR